MLEALQMEFMQNAILAGLLASLACGVIGSLVVVNRIVFISGGIAHTAYGGIGLAFFLGISPLLGAVGFTLSAALIMAWITLKNKKRADTIIGVIWALGMAMGVILMDLTPGYNVDLMSYLFGSILAVPSSDLYFIAALDLLCLGLVFLFYPRFLAISYDEQFAVSRGVPVRALYYLLVVMIALVVVFLIRVVGLLLVIALLTIPTYMAEGWCRSLKSMMFVSSLLCGFFTIAGLMLSYVFNLTSGASIICVAGIFFFASLLLNPLLPAGTGQ